MPFCNVCRNAGKPESVYTSHFVRQTPHLMSPVVCPTILNNVCTHCSGIGHFPSSCPVLKESKKIEKTAFALQKKRKFQLLELKEKDAVKSIKKSNNPFDGLDSSDDEEESIKMIVPEPQPMKPPVNSKARSWYAMADESDSEGEEE